MGIKVSMTSTDVDRQIELLKFYPEVVVKYYRPALETAVTTIEDVIRPMIPIGNSGRLEHLFGSKVSGRQINTIKGQIGWSIGGGFPPPYAHLVEDGAQAHDIVPRKGDKLTKRRYYAGKSAASKLSWPSGYDGGDYVYRGIVHHPGLSGRGFMAAGWSATQPVVDALLAQASEGIVNEMAV